jgi:initiation factor 1A
MPPKKKGNRNVITEDKKRELIIKEDMEEYGRVDKTLGDGRFSVFLCTGETTISIIAKRFRRKNKKGGRASEKVFIIPGDIVLVSFREYENKCDIIHKYEKNEIPRLVTLLEIPSTFSNTELGNNKYEGFVLDSNVSDPEPEEQVMAQNRKFEFDDLSSVSSVDIDNI